MPSIPSPLWLRVPCLAILWAGTLSAPAQVPAPASGAIPADESSTTVDGIAAYVNGDAVTISDVMGGVRMYLNDPDFRRGRSKEDAFRAAYAEALGQLVNQRLILQEYASGEARLPDWVVEKRMSEIIDNRFKGDRAALLLELSKERMTLDDWRQRIEDQMVVAAMRQSQVEANVRVTPAQVRTHYEAHASEYRQPAGTHVGLILVKARAGETEEATARRLQAVTDRLKAGEAFESIARDASDDPSAAKGGDWGWIVPEETLRDELVRALAALEVGTTSAAVQTQAGTYILHKIAQRTAGVRPLEDVRDQIEKELSEAQSKEMFLAWTLRLRSKAKIRTFGEWAGPAAEKP